MPLLLGISVRNIDEEIGLSSDGLVDPADWLPYCE
jgi:hypothetical protein